MIFNSILQRYRQLRKSRILGSSNQFEDAFAFIGVGMHSIQNLYPVLQNLGIRLKWIHSRTLSNASAMVQRFPGAIPTDNLDIILKDPKVKHVFICVHPSVQHSIVLKCIEAGKNCWVEKPQAKNSSELHKIIQIQKQKNVIVVAGHQKRNAPCYQKLKQQIRGPKTYVLSYLTGAFPEGDLLSEIFIHPLDLAIYLFGPVQKIQANGCGEKSEKTIFAIVQHENGVMGSLELSAGTDWRLAGESIKVDCEKGTYQADNFRSLRFRSNGKRLMGIPMEKILNHVIEERIIFSATGFLPEQSQNEIYLAGYYDSLFQFAVSVSRGNTSQLPQTEDIIPVFRLMDQLREIVE